MTDDTTHLNALPLNSMLLEYRLESVLGAGGFGMTYLGWDSNLEKHVAIKEYLPGELAIRALDGSIVPVNTESEYNYKWGLDRFVQEARTLARFSHPNIVRVNRFFEANGTSYMVMDYESGESLYQYLQRAPKPDEAVLKSILLPILDGLAAIHQAGFLHRDIKPSNVFMRENGVPVLIDFGASRLVAANTTKQLTAIVSPGYAPLEQYSGDGNQGPWSDIYALAGVMYRAVTGENPPDAIKRMKRDSVPAALAALRTRYDERFLKAVEWGLKVDETLRPQNVGEWRQIVSGRMPVSALDRAADTAPTILPHPLPVSAPPAYAMSAAVPPRTRVKSATTEMSSRRATVAPGPWKWLWRGALFCMAAIAAASLLKPRPLERDPHRLVSQQGRTAAELPREAVTRAAPTDNEPRRDLDRDESNQRPAGTDTRSSIAEAFRRADAGGTGNLTRGEINEHFPRLADRFDAIDANHDGRITLEEIESAMRGETAGKAASPGSEPRRPPGVDTQRAGAEDIPFAVKKEFMAADRDNDGFLTAWEVKGRFPAIERNLAEVDADRDGRISLGEFAQFRRKMTGGKLPQF